MVVDVDGQKVAGKVDLGMKRVPPHNPYWPLPVSKIGQVTLTKPGTHVVSLRAEKLSLSERKLGLTLVSVELVPAKK